MLVGLAERRHGLVAQLEEMRTKLLAVADDLVVPIEEAAQAEDEDADLLANAADAGPATGEGGDSSDAEETPLDPRYEVLWVQKDESVQIPDLSSIDLEFDDREG
jgi:hypothetical protein